MRPPLDDVRRRLKSLGATTEGPHFESNIVLDNGKLLAESSLLRLRTQEWPDHIRHVLTYKSRPASAAELAAQGIKAREELELVIGDGAMMERILSRLGYVVAARYEKVREEWCFSIRGGVAKIALDTLPFGPVAEIEAPPELIDAAAAALGLDNCEISPKNYYELHREVSQSTAPDILFPPAGREVLRAALHLKD